MPAGFRKYPAEGTQPPALMILLQARLVRQRGVRCLKMPCRIEIPPVQRQTKRLCGVIGWGSVGLVGDVASRAKYDDRFQAIVAECSPREAAWEDSEQSVK